MEFCILKMNRRKTQQWPQDWKRSIFIPIPKKSGAKEHSLTTVLTSHASEGLKILKLGFRSTRTENFQMYKLGFKEAEETDIKLPTFIGSWRKQGSSRETSISASLTKAFDCVHNKLWKILKELEIPDHLTCLLRNLYVDQEAKVRTRHGKTD